MEREQVQAVNYFLPFISRLKKQNNWYFSDLNIFKGEARPAHCLRRMMKKRRKANVPYAMRWPVNNSEHHEFFFKDFKLHVHFASL